MVANASQQIVRALPAIGVDTGNTHSNEMSSIICMHGETVSEPSINYPQIPVSDASLEAVPAARLRHRLRRRRNHRRHRHHHGRHS